MATYIILMNLTEQGIKDIKNAPDRVKATEAALEAAGGKLLGFYLTMGQYDYVAVGGPRRRDRHAAVAGIGCRRQRPHDDAQGVHPQGIQGDSEAATLALQLLAARVWPRNREMPVRHLCLCPASGDPGAFSVDPW
jgi:hypothetical protein